MLNIAISILRKKKVISQQLAPLYSLGAQVHLQMLLLSLWGLPLFWNDFSIIIIIYFENVAFFHTKLGSDVCTRVDNQTYGDIIRFNSTTSGKITISHPWVLVVGLLLQILLSNRSPGAQ